MLLHLYLFDCPFLVFLFLTEAILIQFPAETTKNSIFGTPE